VDKLPSLVTLLDETLNPCNSSQVKFAVRQLAAQEKAKRLFERLFDKDPYTFYHSLRVAELVNALATELKLNNEEMIDATLAALFHDVGKIFTPDSVLKKPGPLTSEEFDIMKLHPADSQKLIETVDTLKHLGFTLRCHHERWDGKGYPDKVPGEKIPWFARLILIADTYDAMTTTRIYRKQKTPAETYAEIERCSGTQFDPTIAPIFIEAHKKLSPSAILREKQAA
jgi:putative nucleotidyltransferase with HDIG domain